jgi:hypothetical protein
MIQDRLEKYSKYIKLCDSYLEGSLLSNEFQKRCLNLFKGETGLFEDDVKDYLGNIFSSVEVFSPSCLPGEETVARISEKQMKREIEANLGALKEILIQSRIAQ